MGDFGGFTNAIGLGSVLGGGSDAQSAVLGPLGGVASDLLGIGGGEEAARQAAALQAQGQQRALEEIRRQFEVTQGQLSPFLEAGTQALPGLQQGATVEGFGQRLGDIFGSGALDPLIQERTRAAQGQLAAGGLTRSGAGVQQIAGIPQELGFQLEQLLSGRQQNLVSGGQQAAAGLGGFGAQASQGVAGQLAGIGRTQSAGVLGAQQANVAEKQQLLQTGATIASLFSDPNLKENVEEIGKIGELNIYQWDWIPETKDTIVEKCGTVGFMADEVEEVFPEYVYSYGGFKIIDYPSLLDRLEVN